MSVGDIFIGELVDTIADEWDSYQEEGCTVTQATTLILEQYEDMLEQDERDVLYLVLGVLQLECDTMDQRVREEVDEMMKTKEVEDYLQDPRASKRLMNQLKKRCR